MKPLREIVMGFFCVWIGLLGVFGFCIGSVVACSGAAEMHSALIIQPMRINLVTPFAEKEAVKALGARWDATKKIWYIADVTDLTPFMRWIPNFEAATEVSTDGTTLPTKSTSKAQIHQLKGPTAKSTIEVPHCGCTVLPWEDCEHTANP